MEEYLLLNDGTVFHDSRAYETGTGLYVYIGDKETNIVDAFSALSNPDATSKIKFVYHKAELIFEGYTEIKSIQDDGTRITAFLFKGEEG